MQINEINGKQYVSVADAAAHIEGVSGKPITAGRIRQIIHKEIEAIKLGNTNWVLLTSATEYANNRKGAGWQKGRPRKTEG